MRINTPQKPAPGEFGIAKAEAEIIRSIVKRLFEGILLPT
jgi:hypothetical protein